MKADTFFDKLTPQECHKPIQADIAWLRMVYRHLTDASTSLHDKEKPDAERIDNTFCPLDNAIVFVEDMLYKSLEDKT